MLKDGKPRTLRQATPGYNAVSTAVSDCGLILPKDMRGLAGWSLVYTTPGTSGMHLMIERTTAGFHYVLLLRDCDAPYAYLITRSFNFKTYAALRVALTAYCAILVGDHRDWLDLLFARGGIKVLPKV